MTGWLTVVEAADYARVHPVTLRKACRTGRLHAVKHGQVWKVRPEWVDAWIENGDTA